MPVIAEFATFSAANLFPALLLVWFAALGGVVGSFLNVVVYRLPAGRSVVYPGSHCPRCDNPIRWYDNIPVLGWLWLHGRCRDCNATISIRYPLVEAFVAALFCAIGWIELLGGGANLPPRTFDGQLQFSPPGVELLIAIALFHALLLATLVAAALIDVDGHLPPGSLYLPALTVALVGPLIWPELRPLPWSGHVLPWQARWLDPLPGLAAGMLAAWLTWAARSHRDRRADGSWATNGDWWLVGLCLGWQATLLVAAAATLLHLAWTGLVRVMGFLPRWPFSVWVLVAVSLLLTNWQSIAARTGGALSSETLWWAAGAMFIALVGAWSSQLIKPHDAAESPMAPAKESAG